MTKTKLPERPASSRTSRNVVHAGVPAELTQFQWKPHPKAQRLLNALVADFLSRNTAAANLADRMKLESGTRFYDWIDSIELPRDAGLAARLQGVGFTRKKLPGAPEAYVHEGAMFPTVCLGTVKAMRVTIKVDSVADFLAVWRTPEENLVEGDPLSQYRRAQVFVAPGAELWVAERHGYRGFAIQATDAVTGVRMLRHAEAFRRRQRQYPTDLEGFRHAAELADAAIADLGRDWACDLWFYSEREYWMRRNRAAQVQYARQCRLGLGWANHDHHTYRSSRECFKHLIAFLEKLGFACRERFYAGAEAGWGAQVIEQPTAGITIFADVDMSPEELLGDFPHIGLPAREEFGTVGLWCALHGEAFLQAGMHHLECQFDWHALVEQLEREAHIRTMKPFTTFAFLRQAFTEGEHWPVEEERIVRLLREGKINNREAELFRAEGALGSHLENLERNDGFKGFNQQGVSDIIARTDPRRIVRSGA